MNRARSQDFLFVSWRIETYDYRTSVGQKVGRLSLCGTQTMSGTTSRLLSWSGIQGMLVAVAVFLVGTPAGFSICGLSWKFPWLADAPAPATANAPTRSASPAEPIAT